MKFERISQKALVLWEILTIIIFSLITWAILFILKPYTWLWYSLLWLMGAIFILIAFLYLPLLYITTEFGINSEAIVYKKGVFFPKTQILYRDRVVFVTVFNNPLTPLLKISSLVVSAAGSSMQVLFINSQRAEQIADILTKNKEC